MRDSWAGACAVKSGWRYIRRAKRVWQKDPSRSDGVGGVGILRFVQNDGVLEGAEIDWRDELSGYEIEKVAED